MHLVNSWRLRVYLGNISSLKKIYCGYVETFFELDLVTSCFHCNSFLVTCHSLYLN
jgi:hypothetical protein